MLAQMVTGLRQFMRRPRWRDNRGASQTVKTTPESIFDAWWYYSVELAPGRITRGIYPDNLPMLPRIMLRRCRFDGLDCLDLGSMEGLIPALMKRQGARRVVAADFSDHCLEKMAAVRREFGVDFEFRKVGLLYALNQTFPSDGFDLINLSGLLYHVFSPMLVLAAVRPLLKRNGLLLVSTNVVTHDGYVMEFNNHGRLQVEHNTFWYPTVQLFDYMLRMLQLAPIDCEFIPHGAIAAGSISRGGNYVFDKPSGYLSVVCRATDRVVAGDDDAWMRTVAESSWEHRFGIDWERAAAQPASAIGYVHPCADGSIDLADAVTHRPPITKADAPRDSHVLRLDDRE